MTKRVDEASRVMRAAPEKVYQAFASAKALEAWLPPEGMTGRMKVFDFREGGSYSLRLSYGAPNAAAKSAEDADDVSVRFVRLVPGERIEQAVVFKSDKPEFAGVMRMTWLFEPDAGGTRVTVRCEDVPPGIGAEDHAAGLASSLANLARFVE